MDETTFKGVQDWIDMMNAPAPSYSKKDLEKWYSRAIDELDRDYAYFVTHVLKLGKPTYSMGLPTAAVAVSEKDGDPDDFSFLFNPDFMAKLAKDGSRGFIMAHETLHIVLNHLRLVRNFVDVDKLQPINDKIRERKALTIDEAAFVATEQIKMQAFNIAADCVINDYLVENGLSGMPGLMYGKANVGYNCAFATVTQVYDDLMKNMKDQMQACQTCGGSGKKPKEDQKDGQEKGEGQNDKQDSGDQEGDGKGKGDKDGGGHSHGDSGEPCPDCGGSGKGQSGQGQAQMGNGFAIDSHDWLYEATKEQIKKAEEIYEKVKNQMPVDMDQLREDFEFDANFDSFNSPAGTGLGAEREFLKQNVTLAWLELLKEIKHDMFAGRNDGPKPRPSYHQQRRKLRGVIERFPDVNLPVNRPEPRKRDKSDEKPAIVLALDTSGSIADHDRKRFVSLAQSIPKDKVHLWAVTFTTQVMELDLDNPKYRDGGTSFACIQRYIKTEVVPQNKGRYPKGVVVITDGFASFGNGPMERPDLTEANSWYWLLTDEGMQSGYGYDSHLTVGKHKALKEFTKS